MEKFDLIVIGSGSANIVIDNAIEKGLKCAMIENGKFGGTCLTRGCIPTKVMVTVADYIREIQHLDRIGLTIKEPSLDFNTVRDRVWEKINESTAVYEYYNEKKNLTLYKGTAKFVSNKVIEVIYANGQKSIITADKIVIGAGARTHIPQVDGLNDVTYLTSESFFGEKFPEKMYESITIIGGGYIGIEFAHIFSAYGAKVNVIQHNQYILPRGEREISLKAYDILSSYGINIYVNKDTVKAYRENGQKVIEFRDRKTGEIQRVFSEEILVAPGVESNADTLNMGNTSVLLDGKGYIRTNEFMETSVPGIYALGDINGMHQFKHKANYEAEILSHNLFNAKVETEYKFVHYDAVPAVAYIHPQVAFIGLTEEQAREKYDVLVAKKYYHETAKGYALGHNAGDLEDGFAKIIIEKESKKILGVHIIGNQAATLLQSYVEIMNSGKKYIQAINEDIASDTTKRLRSNKLCIDIQTNTVHFTDNTMVAHPSLAEVSIWTKYMNFKG